MRQYRLAAFILASGAASACFGQTEGSVSSQGPSAAASGSVPSDPAGLTASVAKGVLGPEYVDASFGFGVRPLAGATVDRRKRAVEGRLQLAQFVRLEIGWSMAVRLWASQRPIDATAAKEALAFDLAVQYPDSAVTRVEALRIAGRDAVRLAANFSAEGQNWLRQQALIRLRPTEYIVVILTTPADDREIAAKTFDQIIESFQVVRTEAQQGEIDVALERGISLKTQVGGGQPRMSGLAQEPVLLRLTREGQSIGLVEIAERSAKVAGKEGVQSVQQAWIFNPDQSVQFLQEEKFVSNDLEYDEWRNMSQLMPSKQTDPQQRLIVNVEAGVRRGDQLIVKYAGTGVDDKQDKVIEVEPSYASGSWPLLLPRVVDLKTPELYAFSMYDSERRGMSLRTFRVTGSTQVQMAGRRVGGFRIEDSEGLVPPVNEIVVDESGRLVLLASGPVEMAVASKAQLEAEFGERIRAVQRQFRQNAGLPEPSAQQNVSPQPAGAKANREPAPRRDSSRSRRR